MVTRQGIGPRHQPLGGDMPATTATPAEVEAREFAAAYPTPNTLRAVALCESGRLGWGDVRDLFARSLAAGIEAVR